MAEPYFQGRESSLQQGIGSLYRRLPTNMRLLIENLLSVDSPITEKDFKPEELEFMREQIADSKRIYEAQEANLRTMHDLQLWRIAGTTGPPREGEEEQAARAAAWRQEDLDKLRSDIESYERTAGRTAVTNPYSDSSSPYYIHRDQVAGGVVDQPWAKSLRRSFTDPRYNVATSLGKYVAEDVDGGMRITDEYNFNQQERNLPEGLAALKRILFSPELAGEYLANALGTSPRNVDINLPDI